MVLMMDTVVIQLKYDEGIDYHGLPYPFDNGAVGLLGFSTSVLC